MGDPLSNIELKSDAQGIDFRPYLIQVLNAVRRNWVALMPESDRHSGKVAIQFAIVPWSTGAAIQAAKVCFDAWFV